MKKNNQFEFQEKVSELRNLLDGLPVDPVVYRWWFPEIPISMDNYIDRSKIATRKISGKDYYLMYVGIGVKCKDRFKWHITPVPHHTLSAIKYRYLSTLRKTVCAVYGIDESAGEAEVNNKLDECFIEWNLYKNKTKSDLEEIEADILNADMSYYPFNIQKNNKVEKEWLRKLKSLRKLHSK